MSDLPISTYSHMFSVWETLSVIKAGMEAWKLRLSADGFIEAVEAMTEFAEGEDHPQGAKTFNGKTHQAFGIQNISKVDGGVDGRPQDIHRRWHVPGRGRSYDPTSGLTGMKNSSRGGDRALLRQGTGTPDLSFWRSWKVPSQRSSP